MGLPSGECLEGRGNKSGTLGGRGAPMVREKLLQIGKIKSRRINNTVKGPRGVAPGKNGCLLGRGGTCENTPEEKAGQKTMW